MSSHLGERIEVRDRAADLSDQFCPVVEHVRRTHDVMGGSGFSVLVIHHDRIVTEHYAGHHSHLPGAKPITAASQFHLASVRKSFIGFAVAWALYQGHLTAIDEAVLNYLPELDGAVMRGVTLRHLLTHTHGLRTAEDGRLYNHFPAGISWDYRDENIRMLCRIVQRTTGRTVADIAAREIFAPLGFTGSGWRTESGPDMVQTVLDRQQLPSWELRPSPHGDASNLFMTTRELAEWGYLHLTSGRVYDRQIVPPEMMRWISTCQSPLLSDPDLPRNGFLWQVQDAPRASSEIGMRVPVGSFQILGMMGQTVLVVPELDLVAVCLLNKLGNPPDYHYLQDVKSWGDTVVACATAAK